MEPSETVLQMTRMRSTRQSLMARGVERGVLMQIARRFRLPSFISLPEYTASRVLYCATIIPPSSATPLRGQQFWLTFLSKGSLSSTRILTFPPATGGRGIATRTISFAASPSCS